MSDGIEQNMIREFISVDGLEPVTGEFEKSTCREKLITMHKCFHIAIARKNGEKWN